MRRRLPTGWAETTMGEICHHPQYGWTCKASKDKGRFKLLRTTDITKGAINWQTVPYCESIPENPKQYLLKESDIVISRAGSVGYSKMIENPGENCIFASYLIRFRLRDMIHPKLISYYLQSMEYWTQITSQSAGIALSNINSTKLSNVKVPLPPIGEQRCITKKIDCLFAKVDTCKARLDKAAESIKRFRKSVLADATSGKLTEDWRNGNDPGLDMAGFHTRLIESRNRYYENTGRSKRASQGKSKQGKKDAPDEILTHMPASWVKVRLRQIVDLHGGVTKGRRFKDRKTVQARYLRVANVQDGYLNLSEIKTIDILPEEKDKYRLETGDLLFTEGGDRDKLGRGTAWRGEIEDCIHQNHVFRARLFSSDILPDYVSIATKSEESRNYFFRNASQSVNLASINMTTLGNLPIAIPPLPEQQEIVRRVESLFALANRLERKLEAARKRVENLTASILAKAFRGELVPQDPNDEPAEKLLERIRAEKARAGGISTKARRPRKRKAREGSAGEAGATGAAETDSRPAAKGTAAGTAPAPPSQAEDSPDPAALDAIMAAFRTALRDAEGLPPDDFLRQTARAMGYRRLGARIRARLGEALYDAARRRVIAHRDGRIHPATQSIDDYTPEQLLKAVQAVMPAEGGLETAAVAQAAARYLGFLSKNPYVGEVLAASVASGVRQGSIVRVGRLLARKGN